MNTDLLHGLESFDLDLRDSELTFTGRLARENGWSGEFTARVVQEYRRFLYLCAEAGHPVTPSDAVDQAWHLHLCYTESYWHELCRETLGFPLHHGPTKGGSDERRKFHEWYSETLTSYRKVFGEEPPPDIWPAPGKRFRPVNFQRINRNENFVIPKKLLSRPVLLAVLSVSLLGCGIEIADGDNSIELTVMAALFVMALIFVAIKFGGNGGGGTGGCGSWGGGCGNSCGGGCGSGCGGGCGS